MIIKFNCLLSTLISFSLVIYYIVSSQNLLAAPRTCNVLYTSIWLSTVFLYLNRGAHIVFWYLARHARISPPKSQILCNFLDPLKNQKICSKSQIWLASRIAMDSHSVNHTVNCIKYRFSV